MKHTYLQSYDEQDSNHKSEVANKINDLTQKEFSVHLVTCGHCWAIHNDRSDDSLKHVMIPQAKDWNWNDCDYQPARKCIYCESVFDENECPDLFY